MFVYGTLKQGQLNARLLEPFARTVEPAWTHGVLFDVGEFPALIQGDGAVRGELVRLDPATIPAALALVDRLEEYQADDEPSSMYLRRIVDVWTDRGEQERAYIYFYNVGHGALPPVEMLVRLDTGEWTGPRLRTAELAGDDMEPFAEHVRTFGADVQ